MVMKMRGQGLCIFMAGGKPGPKWDAFERRVRYYHRFLEKPDRMLADVEGGTVLPEGDIETAVAFSRYSP